MTNELIKKAFDENPPKLESVWPGFPLGTVGVLTGPTGVGKSFWAMEAAIAVAGKVTGYDPVRVYPNTEGRVVYFDALYPEVLLVQRIRKIYGGKPDDTLLDALLKNLSVVPAVLDRLDLANEQELEQVIDTCKNARLIVLDRLDYMHTLNEEKSADMRKLAGILWHIAACTNAAVLCLYPTDNPILKDSAYWAAKMRWMTEEESKRLLSSQDADARFNFVCLEVEKSFPLSDYDENSKGKKWYKNHKNVYRGEEFLLFTHNLGVF